MSNHENIPHAAIVERKNLDLSEESAKEFGLQLASLKEVLQLILRDVQRAQNILSTTDSTKTIRRVLEEMYGYKVDSRVPHNIRNIIEDIRGSVHAMHMHDFTRKGMCDMLGKLIVALEGAIAEEEHAEHVESIRSALMVLFEHADEITTWLEQKKV